MKSSHTPKISIIIPIYNREKYISKCIKSVLDQTYCNLELILVNDGSVDKSGEICVEYQKRDNRIKYIKQENAGVSTARNKGFENSTGDWLYFFDSDDFLEKNFLEKASVYCKKGIDIIQFGTRNIQNGEIILEVNPPKKMSVNNTKDFFKHKIPGPLPAWLHLIRSEVVSTNNLSFNEEMSHQEDLLFIYQVVHFSNKIAFIDSILHNHILSKNSLSRSPVSLAKIKSGLKFADGLLDLMHKDSGFDVLEKELKTTLKGYFVDIKNYTQNNVIDYAQLNWDYKSFYEKHKTDLKSFYFRIAAKDLRLVTIPLKISHLFK